MKYFSISTKGFYDDEIHGDNKPSDCVELSDSEYQSLYTDLNSGKDVDLIDGKLVLKDREYSAEHNISMIESNRRRAYEAEADPLFFKWQREEVTKQEWLDKIEEIKTRYPK